VPDVQIELEFRNVGFFWERGRPEYLEKNLSEQSREPTTNSTHIMTLGPAIETGEHWWVVSALTTAPTLVPVTVCNFLDFIKSFFLNLPVAQAKLLDRSVKKTTLCKKATELPGRPRR